MSRSVKRSFSYKIILSSSVPSSREGLDVVQLCAVIIGCSVSLLMFDGEAVLSSLCTFASSFMYGSCSLSGVLVLSRCLSDAVSVKLSKRVFSFRSNLLDLVIVFCRLKLSMHL